MFFYYWICELDHSIGSDIISSSKPFHDQQQHYIIQADTTPITNINKNDNNNIMPSAGSPFLLTTPHRSSSSHNGSNNDRINIVGGRSGNNNDDDDMSSPDINLFEFKNNNNESFILNDIGGSPSHFFLSGKND